MPSANVPKGYTASETGALLPSALPRGCEGGVEDDRVRDNDAQVVEVAEEADGEGEAVGFVGVGYREEGPVLPGKGVDREAMDEMLGDERERPQRRSGRLLLLPSEEPSALFRGTCFFKKIKYVSCAHPWLAFVILRLIEIGR